MPRLPRKFVAASSASAISKNRRTPKLQLNPGDNKKRRFMAAVHFALIRKIVNECGANSQEKFEAAFSSFDSTGEIFFGSCMEFTSSRFPASTIFVACGETFAPFKLILAF